MPILTIQQRLKEVGKSLQNPSLLENQGIGNEIGFYIFDYDPQDQPTVQAYIPKLLDQLKMLQKSLVVTEINLYHAMLAILESRGFLEKALQLESSKGNAKLHKAMASVIRPEKVVEYIEQQCKGEEDLIFLTGVGASWPVIRSHTILNNLHAVLDQTPVVMFFPGSYDGQELRLFNALKDDNYYRAFPLIPRKLVSDEN